MAAMALTQQQKLLSEFPVGKTITSEIDNDMQNFRRIEVTPSGTVFETISDRSKGVFDEIVILLIEKEKRRDNLETVGTQLSEMEVGFGLAYLLKEKGSTGREQHNEKMESERTTYPHI